MKKFFCVMTLLAFLFCAGCNFNTNTYKSLFSAGSVYDTAMKMVRSFQDQGKISSDQRVAINKVALIFYSTYNVSVDAFVAYFQNPSTTAQGIITTLFTTLSANWADFQALFNSIVPASSQITGTLTLVSPKIGTVKTLLGVKIDVKTLQDGSGKLKTVDISLIIEIAGLVIQYGIPEIEKLITALSKPDVTLADIYSLKGICQSPEKY